MGGLKKTKRFSKVVSAAFLGLILSMLIPTGPTIAATNWWENTATFSDQDTIQIGSYTFGRDNCSNGGNCADFKTEIITLQPSTGVIDNKNNMLFTTGENMSVPLAENSTSLGTKIPDPSPAAIVYQPIAKTAYIIWIGTPYSDAHGLGVIKGISINPANAPTAPQSYWPTSLYGKIELKDVNSKGEPTDPASLLNSQVVILNTGSEENSAMNQRGWFDSTARPVHKGTDGYYYQIDFPYDSTSKQGKDEFLSNSDYLIMLINSTANGKNCLDASSNTPGIPDWKKWLAPILVTNPGLVAVASPMIVNDIANMLKKTAAGEVCDLQYVGGVVFSFNDAGIVSVGDESTDFEKQTNDFKVGIEHTSISPTYKGINMTVTEKLDSPITNALSSVISLVGKWIQSSLSWVMGKIVSLLEDTADYVIGKVNCDKTGPATCGMLGPWTAMRNIGLVLLVMALIIIAFANVLQIDLEQYGLNRMIPKIIISIILAFTSWLIVTFFFDFTKAIQDQAMNLISGGDGYSGLNFLGSIQITTPTAGNIMGSIGSILLLLVILVGTLVCGVVLFFTLLLRIVMLCFLLAVAPLAFILNIVPFTSNLYKQWWSEFFKWMFMGPIALVIIALGAVIANSATGGAFGKVTMVTGDDTGGRLFIGILIFAAAMYVGATLPMQWGGKIMQSFGKMGKNAWGKTGGAALGYAKKSAWDATGGRVGTRLGGILGGKGDLTKQKDKRWALEQRAKMAERGGLGQLITGGDDTDARNMREASIAENQTRFMREMDRDPSKAAQVALAAKAGSSEQIAAFRALGDAGKLEMLGAAKVGGSYGGVDFVDKATGNWADKDTVKKEIIAKGGTATDANNWADKYTTAKETGHTFALGKVAETAISDKKLQDSLLDKNMSVAMGGRGQPLDSASYKMYRGAVSKQSGKSGRELNHNFVKYANNDDFKGVDGQAIRDIATKGTPKSQGALKGRFMKGNLSQEQAQAYSEINPLAEAELLESMGRSARPTVPAGSAADTAQAEAERINAMGPTNNAEAEQAARVIDSEDRR